MDSDLRTLSVLAVFLLVFSGCVFILSDSEETDAATYGSSSSPLSSLRTSADVAYGNTYYVAVGSSVSISAESAEGDDIYVYVSSVSSGYGLSVSGSFMKTGLSGTISKAGTISVGIVWYEGGSSTNYSCTIIAVSESTPVTSVSISGSSSGTVGGSITLTATTSPSSADNRHVTWSITSGSTRASITSTSDTSTGGRCTLSLNSAGSVTVRATAADGSGEYASKTITISNPVTYYTCYLYYNANGGSGAPSTQSYTGTSTSSHSFTISSTEPTRDGFTFKGWSTSRTATTAAYDPGDTISVSYNGSRTLYAVWEEDVTYVSSISISGSSSVKVGSTLTLTATTRPTDADDRGVVWSITSGSTRVTYTTSDTTTGGKIVLTGVSAGSVTIRATAADGSGTYATKTITVSNNTYYLYYNANGGSGAPSTQSYSAGSASTHSFTISSTEPVRDGFDFKGWAINSSGTGTIYQPGGTISVSKNSSVTLYAVWEESEPDLAFTTVPTQDDVTLPEIVYNDDGTYTIKGASS